MRYREKPDGIYSFPLWTALASLAFSYSQIYDAGESRVQKITY